MAKQKTIKTQTPTRAIVSSRFLLALYAVIPLSFLLVTLDYLLLSNQLRDQILPKNPSALAIWTVIFIFPHITSSLITLLDKEYLSFYKKRLLVPLLVIIGGVIIINIVLPFVLDTSSYKTLTAIFLVFFVSYTMYHVLSQQFGIAMMLMKLKSVGLKYEIWRGLATTGATLLYLMVLAEYALKNAQFGEYNAYTIMQLLALVLIAIASIQAVIIAQQSKRKLGTNYMYSNVLMLWAMFTMLWLGYSFFAIAIPRLIHDITAFTVYSVHDQNRNIVKPHNYIYKKLAFIGLPPLILCVLLAIVVANAVQCGGFYLDGWLGLQSSGDCFMSMYYTPASPTNALPESMQIWLQIMLITGFFHYYIEGFIWKKGSLHRQHVSFT